MADGHKLHHIDLGGGLGIPYRADNEPPPDPQAYAAIIKRHTSDLGLKLVFEMGRLIAGNAGILVTQVIYVKQGADRSFVIVDAAMNDLIRPTLYDAFHDIKPVEEPGRTRRASSPTWSDRSAKPAIIWRLPATCRWSSPAT